MQKEFEKMRYLSFCSGVEAASLAWMPLGWEAVAFSEIDPFACAVLQHRYPNVPNLGDCSKIHYNKEGEELYVKEANGVVSRTVKAGRIDLCVGGFPCQSFSVAGSRKGLEGLSGLVKEYFRLLDEVRPKWFVYENVPGMLSSNHGRDFRFIMQQFDALGYSCAWRVLDTQFVRTHSYPRAIPQRRRRVFVVGHSSGDWRYPAEVLFEQEGLFGNPPPRRIKGKGFTAGVEGSVGNASTITDRAGKPGGGKGPLVSNELSLTFSTRNNQALVSVHGARTPIVSKEYAHPLGAVNEGLENCIKVIDDQGGERINVEKHDVSPTLRRETKHHEPLVMHGGGHERN